MISESGEMIDKLKHVPGMDKMEDILKSMGGKDLEEMMKGMGCMGVMGGMGDLFKSMSGNKNARFNKGAFNQHMKSTQIRQRLKKKLEEKRKAEILMSMMQQKNMPEQNDNIEKDESKNEEIQNDKQDNKYNDDWLEFTTYNSSGNKPNRSSINKNNNNKKKKKNKKKK